MSYVKIRVEKLKHLDQTWKVVSYVKIRVGKLKHLDQTWKGTQPSQNKPRPSKGI